MRKYNLLQHMNIFLYVIFALLMFFVISNKQNMHIDEILTYGLANYTTGWMAPMEAETYTPASSAWLEYVAVNRNNRFDYDMVWRNQAGDVHPPLYYAFVHTICSIFTGKFSIWFAGVINIFFALLTLWTVRRILYELTQSQQAVLFGSILFILSAGILSAASFFRMYVMAMFEVTFITLLFMQAALKGCSRKFYIAIIPASVAGALTHYYFIIFLFFLSLIFGIYLLIKKNYKDTVLFILFMLLSGRLSTWIFPSMIKHMFLKEGYRGQQSIENLKQTSIIEYIERLKTFYQFLNSQLFGGFLTYLLIAITLFIIIGIARKSILLKKERNILWILTSFPCICYFLFITKTAVMFESRYISPIYAVVMVNAFSLLYIIIKKLVNKKYDKIVLCILLTIMTVNGWRICTWEYLFLDSAQLIKKAGQHRDENAIYIYDAGWETAISFFEASHYKSITFFHINNIQALQNSPCKNDSSLIVYITNSCNIESILNNVMEICPALTGNEEMGTYGYATSYYLYDPNLR
ncbi:hypothetical protein D5281_08975 [bacterium 1xD42-62]|uniref:Glycosyltransferase RgtA/B/C/D-like domain-containing protein n=2 Tax=Parablautia muri TaxID=2320879 RepID=A0A9X5GRV4_9FIRM|nr:hypothetical protein [Parablautia muri]